MKTFEIPTTQTKPDSERTRWAILIGVCLISAMCGRFCYLTRPFDNDAAIFIYMGKMVSEGGRLCHDLFDNKFPTVGLMTTVLWRTIGLHWWGYIALQTSLSLLGAWLLGQMARREVGEHAFWPTALFTVVYFNFTTAVFGGFQLETVQAFFSIMAARSALMAMKSDNPADSFLAGLLAGCGAMFKPTGLAVLGAMAIAMLVVVGKKQQTVRKLSVHFIAVGFGIAIPLGCAALYLIEADILRDMPALWRQISTYASQTAWAPEDLLKPMIAIAFIGFPIAVRGWIYRRHREVGMSWPTAPVFTFAICWLVVEIAGVVMQRRMYAYHFLPIVPPAALVFGMFPRTARPIPLAAALLPMALLSIYAAGDVVAITFTGNNRLPASEYLSSHTQSGDAVWTDCWPRLALETNLRPGARIPFTFLFANYDNAGLDYSQQMIEDFERIKPAYIFLPTPMEKRIGYQLSFVTELVRRPARAKNYAEGWHQIQRYTLAHYDREAMIGSEAVYRRKPEAWATAAIDPREIK